MVYGNVFLQNNITEEEHLPMSLEEQVEYYREIIEEIFSGNEEFSDEYLYEFTNSNKEYIKETNTLNKKIKNITRDFKKAYKEKNKKECLAKLKEMNDCLSESKAIVDKLNPDLSDTIISHLFIFIKTCVVTAIMFPVSLALTKQLAIASGLSSIPASVSVSMNMPKIDNPYQHVKDKKKKWNAFFSKYTYFFNEYKKYIKMQTANVNKMDW